jgi:6-phospho-3-hexuloisomerase
MSLYERYTELCQTVLKEHQAVFESQELAGLEAFMVEILASCRIFILGVGREGIAARAFAMRLMHLGKEVHWIWDDTTPGMTKGDLFIAVSGSGRIGHIQYVAQQAKRSGAAIAVVTGTPGQVTPALADYVVFVPAAVYNGTDERCVPSIQPMGTLFEQHCFLLFDILIMLLEEKVSKSHAEMEARHRNIE